MLSNARRRIARGITQVKPKPVRGMNDILPEVSATWRHVERIVREVIEMYGYHEIRLPVLEYTEVFARAIGDESIYEYLSETFQRLKVNMSMNNNVLEKDLQMILTTFFKLQDLQEERGNVARRNFLKAMQKHRKDLSFDTEIALTHAYLNSL